MAVSDESAELVVLGSANLDLVYEVDSIPRPGQTVLATGHARHAGGKGLNQAVAAARAGARTAFICTLGDDADGRALFEVIDEAGVETRYVHTVDAPTGTALITVQHDGDNAIVVAAGANGTMTELDADQRHVVAAARVLVAQQEVPREVVAEAAAVARSTGTTFVLNAAPATAPDPQLLALVDVLVVNESEAITMAGAAPSDSSAEGSADGAAADGLALQAARSLAERVRTVIVTLGDEGCAVLRRDVDTELIPALKAKVVDTTGAGDTFTGVLAAGVAEGLDLVAAARRAVAAAAISVERRGAVPSIPTRAEIDDRSAT